MTINDLWMQRPDLYDRTKLPKGHPDRLTLPKAKREAQKRNLLPPGVVELDAKGRLVMLITGGNVYRGETAKLVADRYIARTA